MFNQKVVELGAQLSQLEQLVVHIDVTLEKVVGVTVGIHQFTQKKDSSVLMIL